jgi:hypothetical protein
MPASRDLTSSAGEVFLCPALRSLPLSCVTVTDTALTSPSKYPPESSPLTPSSRWRAATHSRGITSSLTVAGWPARVGVIILCWYTGMTGRDEGTGTVERWSMGEALEVTGRGGRAR